MNYSKIISVALVGVVSALVLVQAGHYGGSGASSDSHSLAHYGGGACHGYGCNNQAPRHSSNGANGPYHSYAVRPVVYGGHGMYHYKGYARHAPAPVSSHHGRYARSYGLAPRRHHGGAGGCRGYNCGGARAAPARHHYAAPARHHYAAPARHHYAAPARQHYAAPARQHYSAPARNHYAAPARQHYGQSAAPKHHSVRPIYAVALVADHSAQSSYGDHHRGGYGASSNSYGRGHNSAGYSGGSSGYGASNGHHGNRHHGGGYGGY